VRCVNMMLIVVLDLSEHAFTHLTCT